MPDPWSARSVSGVELSREADVVDDLDRDPQVAEDRLSHALERGQLHEHRERALRQRVEQALVDADLQLWRMRGAHERVHDVARALGVRVGEVERLAVEA